MSTPIAIIHWESNATLGSGKPRVAHIYDDKEITNRNFIGITAALVFMLPVLSTAENAESAEKVVRVCDALAREAGCPVTVQPFGETSIQLPR